MLRPVRPHSLAIQWIGRTGAFIGYLFSFDTSILRIFFTARKDNLFGKSTAGTTRR